MAKSPICAGMPAGYLKGHTEAHLNANHTGAGHLSRTHEHLQSKMMGAPATPRTPMGSGSGRSAEDEEGDV